MERIRVSLCVGIALVMFCGQAGGQAAGTAPDAAQAPAGARSSTMNEFPRRAIHLDTHTMPGIYDVGSEFDAAEFARTLSEAHVDYITVFAKCNLGFAYYPTEIGQVYPGLQVDLLGQMVEACHARGIRVAAYFNVGIDHEHARLHREWCKVDKEGRVYRFAEKGHWFRDLCLNTGFREHILGMVREVLDRYPVDGIFLDCYDLAPCYGTECVQAMKQQGMDVFNDAQAAEFCWQTTNRFMEEVEGMARAKRPDIYVLHNGIAYRRQPTHIELEVLPTGGWGYDYLPMAIRYARTVDKPYFTMTGRFHKSWGDLGGIRTKHSLLFDCYYSIANGGTCSVGDHFHPRGKLNGEVYRLIQDAYKEVQTLEPWTAGARGEAEIVVLEPHMADFPSARTYSAKPDGFSLDSVKGAARILSELKCQFDISDGTEDLSKYTVIVLADSVRVSEALKPKLEAHLARGGGIVSSGFAGLTPDGMAFGLSGVDLVAEGPEPFNPTFVEALPPLDKGFPAMPVTVYQQGLAMKAGPATEVLARLHQPYTNLRSWDFEHETLYCPPDKDTGRPAIARCGNVIHFSFPLFLGYMRDAVVPHRILLDNALRLLLPQPMLEVANFPSFGRATVTARDRTRLVHLLTYVPESRGSIEMIEEPVVVSEVAVGLRSEGRDVTSVTLAPGGETLPFTRDGDYVRFTVPRVEGYQLIVVE